MLEKVALENDCDADWLWQIVTGYGLFDFGADETFSSPYFSKILGIDTDQGKYRVRERTRYNEDNYDNNYNKDKENKEHIESTQSVYLGYDRLVNGQRYGFRGEPIAHDAPEQVNQDTRWSWIDVQKMRWQELGQLGKRPIVLCPENKRFYGCMEISHDPLLYEPLPFDDTDWLANDGEQLEIF